MMFHDGTLRGAPAMVRMVHMRRTPLVEAKAHLSELVDAAEHRGKRVLILRHGKPAAAIVPVAVAEGRDSKRAGKRLPPRAFAALLDRMAAQGKSRMTTSEALGRNRLASR